MSARFHCVDFLQHSRPFADAVLLAFDFKRAFLLDLNDSTRKVERISAMTQSTIEFEQMITAMRGRLRPNGARLLADWLRSCVGLSENRLLRKLSQELNSPEPCESESLRTQESWPAQNDVDTKLYPNVVIARTAK